MKLNELSELIRECIFIVSFRMLSLSIIILNQTYLMSIHLYVIISWLMVIFCWFALWCWFDCDVVRYGFSDLPFEQMFCRNGRTWS